MNSHVPRTTSAPWYQPVGDEVQLFEAAWAARLPVLLKGPTGCGKTRFVEYMSTRVRTASPNAVGVPLITVSCHEDLTANDLVGRHLLVGEQTVWQDGPLTHAARHGGICYLDEIVEARRDATVVIHSLSDHRRLLAIEKTGEELHAHPDFHLVISYNPGFQTLLKELKPSTRQRFVALDFNYPSSGLELAIVVHESGLDENLASALVSIAGKLRALNEQGATDAVSTRALIHAARLIKQGIAPRRACGAALASALGDDADVQRAANDLIDVMLP